MATDPLQIKAAGFAADLITEGRSATIDAAPVGGAPGAVVRIVPAASGEGPVVVATPAAVSWPAMIAPVRISASATPRSRARRYQKTAAAGSPWTARKRARSGK